MKRTAAASPAPARIPIQPSILPMAPHLRDSPNTLGETVPSVQPELSTPPKVVQPATSAPSPLVTTEMPLRPQTWAGAVRSDLQKEVVSPLSAPSSMGGGRTDSATRKDGSTIHQYGSNVTPNGGPDSEATDGGNASPRQQQARHMRIGRHGTVQNSRPQMTAETSQTIPQPSPIRTSTSLIFKMSYGADHESTCGDSTASAKTPVGERAISRLHESSWPRARARTSSMAAYQRLRHDRSPPGTGVAPVDPVDPDTKTTPIQKNIFFSKSLPKSLPNSLPKSLPNDRAFLPGKGQVQRLRMDIPPNYQQVNKFAFPEKGGAKNTEPDHITNRPPQNTKKHQHAKNRPPVTTATHSGGYPYLNHPASPEKGGVKNTGPPKSKKTENTKNRPPLVTVAISVVITVVFA